MSYNENSKVRTYTTEDEEYEETINQLKRIFRKKLEKKLIDIHIAMKDDFSDVLGEEFSLTMEKRSEIIEKFKEIESEMLRFGATFCGAEKALNELATLVQSKEPAKKKESLGKQLFNEIMEKVNLVKPELVTATKETHKKIVANTKLLTEIVKSHHSELEEIEKSYRNDLQKDIVTFIIEYTAQLNEVNKGFGKSQVENVTPFDGDYKLPEVNVFDDVSDEIIIPFKGNNEIIN